MKKLRVYLETSAISYLDQPERGILSVDSHRLWERIKAGEFEAVISSVVIDEIAGCDDQKRDKLNGYLDEIEYTAVEIDRRAVGVANRFVDLLILKERNFVDCLHNSCRNNKRM